MNEDQNQQRNREHYEKVYTNYNLNNILYWVRNLDKFLHAAITTETSWYGLYQDDFRERIKGKKVLEMGCGNCLNAGVMAALGAEVYANDIAPSSGIIVEKLNTEFEFAYPIKFVEGDFLQNNLPANEFDFVIGKAFLHHLSLPVEKLFLKETARLLKEEGEARFFEPAVNSKLLNKIRWYIPVGIRPSKFNKTAFKKWKEEDPHPERNFSSRHWEKAGKIFFAEVKTIPVGALERFSRLMKWGRSRENFRRRALKAESYLPGFLNRPFTRSQLIIYRLPLKL